MAGVYDEVEIEDMDFDEETGIFTYPCPCGDKFQFTIEMLKDNQDIGTCPSCSLTVRIIYDKEQYQEFEKMMQDFKDSQ